MRVLHVYQDFYPKRGGIEDHILSLCRYSSADCTVLVSNNSVRTRWEIVKGVQVIRAGRIGRYFTPFCPTMPLEIRRARPDVIHLHLPCPMAVVAVALARLDVPIVVGYHNDIVQQEKLLRFYRPILQHVLKRSSRILSGTVDYANSSSILTAHREKWAIVPYGIETDRFDYTDDVARRVSELQARYDGKRVLFIGRLCYYKGLDYLIPAMQAVNATLLIGGVGPWEKQLRQLVDEHGLTERVHFLGNVDDDELTALYYAADVVTLPSTWRSEAYGLVQLEAFACGKPVVSTDLPGVATVNKHGATVPARSSQALASALNELLADEARCQKVGRQGREIVAANHQIAQMVTHIEDIYADVERSDN